jgi:hypothetical protein
MELTKYDRELLQLYRDADESGKLFIFDMLLCAATCGEEFFQELQATPQEPAALKAVVSKWKATIPAEVAV